MSVQYLIHLTAKRLYVALVGKRVFTAALLMTAFFMQSCTLLNHECTTFYSLNEEQRKEKIKTYPLEKQLALYQCGMRMEPPYLDVAGDIAEEGPKIIPFLLEKLRTESFDGDKEHIVYIFRIMSAIGKLDCRQDVIEQIDQSVNGMRIDVYKEGAKKDLDDIKSDSCKTKE